MRRGFRRIQYFDSTGEIIKLYKDTHEEHVKILIIKAITTLSIILIFNLVFAPSNNQLSDPLFNPFMSVSDLKEICNQSCGLEEAIWEFRSQ